MGSLIGETETRTLDVVNVGVKYPGAKSGREELDAPAGLAILSFKAIERIKYGNSGYSFSLVGDNSVFVDDRSVDSKFKSVFDYIETNVDGDKKQDYKQRIEQLREEALRVARATASTNSKLIVEWHCKHAGNEFDRKGGALSLGVEIEFMRGLTTRNLDSLIAAIIQGIQNKVEPKDLNLQS